MTQKAKTQQKSPKATKASSDIKISKEKHAAKNLQKKPVKNEKKENKKQNKNTRDEEVESLFVDFSKKSKRVPKTELKRFTPNANSGLTGAQVKQRIADGWSNHASKKISKSYWNIFIKNIFTFFNLVCFAVAAALIAVGAYADLTFMAVVLANMAIGIIQEIKAKITIEKLSLTNSNFTKVVRDGEIVEIYKHEVVLDDILQLSSGTQIVCDSVVVEGTCEVNESLLTGESLPVRKTVGDGLLAGSFISSGGCKARVDKVGDENYVEKLSSKVKKYSQPKSELLISLKYIIKSIIVLMIPIAILMYYNNLKFFNGDMYNTVTKTAGSIIGMIPAGMFLLTSVALAVGVIRLAKKRTLVQELYCIEMLARVNVLCLDKTGTLTDGSMKVQEMIMVGKSKNYKEMSKIVSSIVNSFHENNHTALALKAYFGNNIYYSAEKAIPFSSERKFMACKFKTIGTYKIGAYDYICNGTDAKVSDMINDYSEKGMRVLAVVKAEKDVFAKNDDVVAIIILQDNIRKDAPQTIEWFKKNNVDIKVISGDNAITVSEVARRVGVENYDKYISLQGMSKDEVIKAAGEYTIFGRVSPEQKSVLVKALKALGKTVAMTGDGVNDILALKEADCSIAIAAGSEAARSVSHLVLLDSNFSSMPSVVAEGRRVVNNIQKSSSLFLMKTIFVILISLFVLIFNKNYPFSPVQFFLLESFVIGLPSFFLALQPNTNIIKGHFVPNIFRNALPAGLLLTLNVIALYIYQSSALISTEAMVTMASLVVTVFGLTVLYKLCKPYNIPKVILVCSMILVVILAVALIPGYFKFVPLTLENKLFMMVQVLISWPLYDLLVKAISAIKIKDE